MALSVEALNAAFDRAGVPTAERPALKRLVLAAPEGADADARLLTVLTDHAHWRLYLASRQGDSKAAAAFESHWRSAAMAFFGTRFGRADADEMTARFFERVYSRVGEDFRFESSFSAYLRTILLNLARDRVGDNIRRRRREKPIEDESAASIADRLAAGGPSAEELLLADERATAVRAALDELSSGDRHLLLRCVVEGESGETVAKDLGVKPDALYQRLTRARRRLKDVLEAAEPVRSATVRRPSTKERQGDEP